MTSTVFRTNPGNATNGFIERLRLRYFMKKDRLQEAHVRLRPGNLKAAEMNIRLFAAFKSNNEPEMLRLVRAGADPDSIIRNIDKEFSGS
ncbi:hypothetical protein GF415_00800 [Candidatus Micrarchaeota archaeon]|nr:hypothetical protein [Candidatus Micrarchaeota archaeon]